MYIDAVAIRMQKRQESVWRAAMLWLVPDDIPTRVPTWRFAGALGALFLAGYLGQEISRWAVGEPDTPAGVIESSVSVASDGAGSIEAGELTDVLVSGSNAEVEAGLGAEIIGDVPASGIDLEDRVLGGNLRPSDTVPRVRVGQFASLEQELEVVQQRRVNMEARTSEISAIYRDAEVKFRAVERACSANRWEFGQGPDAPDLADLDRRLKELDRERREIENTRKEIESVNEELKGLHERIRQDSQIKGEYEQKTRAYLQDIVDRYLDPMEEMYNAKILENIREVRDIYALLHCAGKERLDALPTIPG